jgi:hypothetical protein
MKKIIFALLLLLTISTGYSQIEVTTSPQYGCPNTTHNVNVIVTNNSSYSIPPGVSYTINVTVQTTAPVTTIGTFSQSYTDGFGTGTANSKTYIVSVAFQGPMDCDVSGTLTIPSFPPNPLIIPYSTQYTVQNPADVTLTESPAGTLLVASVPSNHEIRFYLDGSSTHTSQTSGSYTPTTSGSYTAKAYELTSTCLSENPSNAVVITVVPTDVRDGQSANVSVYPNPIASTVTITTVLSNKLSYELSDLNGSVVRSADFRTNTNINVENLKPGSYILTVRDNNQKVASYKLVK